MPQVQGPGQGRGDAEKVPYLGCKGVDKVQKGGAAVVPAGLPVVQVPSHHLGVVGSLLGSAAPGLVVT